jgi:hypothetical protein
VATHSCFATPSGDAPLPAALDAGAAAYGASPRALATQDCFATPSGEASLDGENSSKSCIKLSYIIKSYQRRSKKIIYHIISKIIIIYHSSKKIIIYHIKEDHIIYHIKEDHIIYHIKEDHHISSQRRSYQR